MYFCTQIAEGMIERKSLGVIFLLVLLLLGGTRLMAQSPRVLVSEVLFNPEPGGADYVELYNAGTTAVPLADLRLARMVGDSMARLFSIASEGALQAGSWLVVTTDAAYVMSHYTVHHPERLLEVSSMPSYNDASGIVAVTTSDSMLLDRLDYSESMHSRLLHDKEGVALERRSYEVATSEPSNWYSAASTAGYGTPTYRNSQSREFLFVDDDFCTEPPLFSPDGDGYNDQLDITYHLQQCDLAANITLYDAHGRMVRQLARGLLLGCQGVVSWDGTDDSGRPCPRGSYVAVVEAYNENGANQSWRRKVSLVRNL